MERKERERPRNPKTQGVLEDMFKKNFQKSVAAIQAEALKILSPKSKR